MLTELPTSPLLTNEPLITKPEKPKRRWSKKRLQLLLGGFLLLFIVGGLIIAFITSRQSQELRGKATFSGATITMTPTTINVKVGETVTINQIVNSGNDSISAAEIHILYPHQLLEYQSLTAGTFLPVILKAAVNSGNEASIILGSQPTLPQKGTGILSKLTFKALQPGTATITYANTTQVAAIGKTGSIVTPGSSASIIISAVNGSPLPSVSPSPLASPSPSSVTSPNLTPKPSASPMVTPSTVTINQGSKLVTVPALIEIDAQPQGTLPETEPEPSSLTDEQEQIEKKSELSSTKTKANDNFIANIILLIRNFFTCTLFGQECKKD